MIRSPHGSTDQRARAHAPVFGGSFWGANDVNMEDLLASLPTATPRIAFRYGLDYSQVGIALTGEVVRRVTARSWPDFVQERILEPLGMNATYPSASAFLLRHPDPAAVENLMGRAVEREGRVVDASWRGAKDIYAPAGGLVTTAEDMTRFMLFLLAGGRAGGRRLLSEPVIREMYVPHQIENTEWASVTNPRARVVAYGLGWYVYEYEGRLVVEHGGANAGSSVVALLPEEGVGVFVSTGATYPTESNRLASALKFAAIDRALGLERKDWARLHSGGDGVR